MNQSSQLPASCLFLFLWPHCHSRQGTGQRGKSNKNPHFIIQLLGCLWQGLGPDYAPALAASSADCRLSTNGITRTDGRHETARRSGRGSRGRRHGTVWHPSQSQAGRRKLWWRGAQPAHPVLANDSWVCGKSVHCQWVVWKVVNEPEIA